MKTNNIKSLLLAGFLTLSVVVLAQELRSINDAKGLALGQSAPMFQALSMDSSMFNLKASLQHGPVVIIFYRGFWCPVCNKHLSGIQDSLKMLEDIGVKVIAISPEKPKYLDRMAEKSGAQFALLYDEGYKIAKAFDVLYMPTKGQLFSYNAFLGAKLKKTHTDNSQQLPIPATFIINQKGEIIWRQFDTDYHNRSSIKAMLDFLKSLN
ncbi:MAG: AhpC/TSA family protein [Bacteroidales bacterium]|nr:AhpC/TSA family protein [Bacteroidales bacterium]